MAASPGVQAATPRVQWLPAVFRNHVAFVEGRVEDRGPYWFLVDTGASVSALDSSVAHDLGLAAQDVSTVVGTAGTISVGTVRMASLSLGDFTVRDLRPTTYDLSGALAPEGAHIAGILGYDVLGRSAVLFDRRQGRLGIAVAARDFARRTTATIPFRLDNGIPRLAAVIDGLAVELRLDTGASIASEHIVYVNVTQPVFDRLKAAHPGLAPSRYFTATGAGGAVIRIAVAPGRSLRLGRQAFADPQLIVQPASGYFADPNAVGFLGAYSLLRTGGFIVDYPARRLILLA